jgi:hypothetical protein
MSWGLNMQLESREGGRGDEFKPPPHEKKSPLLKLPLFVTKFTHQTNTKVSLT